jgi:hypothetical protein
VTPRSRHSREGGVTEEGVARACASVLRLVLHLEGPFFFF